MAFFNSAVTVLQTLVIALGAGLGIWGAINLLERYGNDNPGAKSQGMKQLMAGGGVALIGTTLAVSYTHLFHRRAACRSQCCKHGIQCGTGPDRGTAHQRRQCRCCLLYTSRCV